MSVLGVLHPCCCTDGGKIWRGGGDRSPPPRQISPPSVQRVAPAIFAPGSTKMRLVQPSLAAARARIGLSSTNPSCGSVLLRLVATWAEFQQSVVERNVKGKKERKSIYIALFGQGGTFKALRHGSHSFTCK